MKAMYVMIALLAMSARTEAQNVYHLRYKAEVTKSNYGPVKTGVVSEFDIKSNDEYGHMTTTYMDEKNAKMSATTGTGLEELFDYKNSVVVYFDPVNKLYKMEATDSVYKKKIKVEETSDVEVINDHKCHAYKIKEDVPDEDVQVTIWVNKDVKVYPKLNAFFLKYLFWYYFPGSCDVPGLVERVDCRQKLIGKKVIETSYTLTKSSEMPMTASEFKLPWLDKDFSAAIPCQESRTSAQGKTTVIVYASSKSEGEAYIERMKKLYHKVTGQVLEVFKCFNGRNR